MTQSIEDQIAAAQAAAANLTAQQGQALAPGAALPTQAAMAPPPGAGRRLGDEDMMIGGISVDVWWKPTHFGVQFGDKAQLVPSFVGTIDLRETALKFSIKFGNNPATYLSTYDGVTCASGGSWEQAIARGKAVDPNCRPYNSIDLPVVIAEEVKAPNGEVLVEVGKRAGYATSTTNWNNWEVFYNWCKANGFNRANPNPDRSVVKVRITNEPRAKGSNKWGVAKFEFIEWIEEVETGE